MEKLIVCIPAMYADHHVLRVRDALLCANGVSTVAASAAKREVSVEYDEATISPQGIVRKLVEIGYLPDQDLPLSVQPPNTDDHSAWYTLIHRVTKTETKDLEMSGDFRRY